MNKSINQAITQEGQNFCNALQQQYDNKTIQSCDRIKNKVFQSLD